MSNAVAKAADDSDNDATDDQTLLDKPAPAGGRSVSSENFWDDPNYEKSSLAIQSDPRYYIDAKKCRGCCRGYIRQDWDTLELEHGLEEKKAEWMELFFDLIFVACIVRISFEAMHSIPSIEVESETNELSHRRFLLSEHISEEHEDLECVDEWGYSFLLTCFSQFGLLTIFWTEQTMMETHFILNQIWDYLLRLCFMSFVLCCGIFIQDDQQANIAFQISYIGLKIICILIYSKVFMIERAKIHAVYHIMQCLFVIIGLIEIAGFYRGCAIDYFYIYTAFFVFEYGSIVFEWTCMRSGQLYFALPVHVAHLAERFGLFIMLILGESIISIMTVELSAFNSQLVIDVGFILMAFFMSFMIATLYYDSQPSEEEIMHGHNNHALKTNRTNRLGYFWGHQQIFFGLLAYGVGVKIAGHRLFDNIISREWVDIILPAYGLVAIILALFLIRSTHPNKSKNIWVWLLRFVILIIMCIMPIFAVDINQSIIFGVVFFMVFLLLILDVEGHAKRKHAKKELREKREHAKQNSMDRHLSQHQQELSALSDI